MGVTPVHIRCCVVGWNMLELFVQCSSIVTSFCSVRTHDLVNWFIDGFNIGPSDSTLMGKAGWISGAWRSRDRNI